MNESCFFEQGGGVGKHRGKKKLFCCLLFTSWKIHRFVEMLVLVVGGEGWFQGGGGGLLVYVSVGRFNRECE